MLHNAVASARRATPERTPAAAARAAIFAGAGASPIGAEVLMAKKKAKKKKGKKK